MKQYGMAIGAEILFSALIFFASAEALAATPVSGKPIHHVRQEKTADPAKSRGRAASPRKEHSASSRLSARKLEIEEIVTQAGNVRPQTAPALSVFISSDQRKATARLRRIQLFLLRFAVAPFYSL